MAEPFIGEIRTTAFNYAPRGWALCDGSLINIRNNTALFSVLGTEFGGDGVNTFGLPDLRGRLPIGQGTGTGLTPREMGDEGGAENVTLITAQLPVHGHLMYPPGTGNEAQIADPTNSVPATTGSPLYSSEANTQMASFNSEPTGAGMAHDNMPPFQVINYIIALQGMFPSRP
jgi:microcystin-dependent protein